MFPFFIVTQGIFGCLLIYFFYKNKSKIRGFLLSLEILILLPIVSLILTLLFLGINKIKQYNLDNSNLWKQTIIAHAKADRSFYFCSERYAKSDLKNDIFNQIEYVLIRFQKHGIKLEYIKTTNEYIVTFAGKQKITIAIGDISYGGAKNKQI